ncbi:MAG: hypothetical protein J6M35_02655 [Clostridia bacterium]|nr:hypothetical protein [Clostridia bacterium]
MKLLNNIMALVLPGAFSVFNMLLVLSFFRNVSSSFDDAARIDGAGQWLTPEEQQRLAKMSPEGIKASQMIIGALPILAVYPFLQKYFITGITLGSVKE